MKELNTNTIKARIGEEPAGIGGWLAVFQIWMYMNFMALVGLLLIPKIILYPMIAAFLAVFTAASILCMVLFYMRKMAFRIIYVVIVAVHTALIILTGYTPGPLIWESMLPFVVIGLAIVIALFTSRRVKNTFN